MKKTARTIKAGAKVLVTKGPGVFMKMSAAKLRSRRLKQTTDTIAEEYAYVSNPVFQITENDIVLSKSATSGSHPKDIKTANWFIPYFEHVAYGGAYTMMRFVNYAQEKGVQNRIIIYDRSSVDKAQFKKSIVKAFPGLKDTEIIMLAGEAARIKDLPASDIAICTAWQSAYFLLKFNKTQRKYYFAMDYEPLFYPAGAMYALAESTYRFPFRGVVNTPGLLAAINQRHGMTGISYVPAVDTKIYHPEPAAIRKQSGKPRIFFFTRPSSLRNAFALMVLIMKQLKDEYSDKIEIVSAGAAWDEKAYGLDGRITNLGLLQSLPEVAALYRTCDIGVVYMLSKHPSYQPFEYMASGMATVTNNNEDNWWLLKHEDNCLAAEPSAAAMVEQIKRLIDDEALRQKIVKNGLKTVENSWEYQTDLIWNDMKHA